MDTLENYLVRRSLQAPQHTDTAGSYRTCYTANESFSAAFHSQNHLLATLWVWMSITSIAYSPLMNCRFVYLEEASYVKVHTIHLAEALLHSYMLVLLVS